MANAFEPHWDEEQDRPPFTWRRARLGRQAGSDRLGASLFELPPGCSSFPLHIHHANEELLVVVCGRPTLRTLDGERQLEEGELVAFPSGRTGAHRIDNRGEQPARVLIVSTMLAPEINEYPTRARFGPGLSRPAPPVRTRRRWTSSCARMTSAPTTSTTSAEPRRPCGAPRPLVRLALNQYS